MPGFTADGDMKPDAMVEVNGKYIPSKTTVQQWKELYEHGLFSLQPTQGKVVSFGGTAGSQ